MAIPFSNTKLRIPRGFANLLEGLTREVLREQPRDIPHFAANYFSDLLKNREAKGFDPAEWGASQEDRFYNNQAFQHPEDNVYTQSSEGVSHIKESFGVSDGSVDVLQMPDLPLEEEDKAQPEEVPSGEEDKAETQEVPLEEEHKAEPQDVPLEEEHKVQPQDVPSEEEDQVQPHDVPSEEERKVAPQDVPSGEEDKTQPQEVSLEEEHKAEPQDVPSEEEHKVQSQDVPKEEEHKEQPQDVPSEEEHKVQPQDVPSEEEHKVQPQGVPSGEEDKTQPQEVPSEEGHKVQPEEVPSEEGHKVQPQEVPSEEEHKVQPQGVPSEEEAHEIEQRAVPSGVQEHKEVSLSEDQAATLIQAAARGYLIRHRKEDKSKILEPSAQQEHHVQEDGLQTDTTEKKEEAADKENEPCIKHQEEALDIALDDPGANAAATKIQAGFRGHMTRKKMKEGEKELQHKDGKEGSSAEGSIES